MKKSLKPALFPQGDGQDEIKFSEINFEPLKKSAAILLAFLFFVTPLAPALAQEAPATHTDTSTSTSAPATDSSTAPVSPAAPIIDISPTTPSAPTADQTQTPSSDTSPVSPTPAAPSDSTGSTDNTAPTTDTTNPATQPTSPQPLSASQSSTNLIPVNAFNPENQTYTDQTSGALIHDYPISVPPGRNGFQPNLKISYNSQQKDNSTIFSYGWGINIPYIQRLNKQGADRFYTATSTDWFFTSSLSGELAFTASSTVASSTVYSYATRADSGDFLNYSFDGSTWTVTDKQGTVYKFGSDTSGQQNDPNNISHVYKWMLQETRDTNNNYVKYQYSKDSGQIYPSQIIYTGNGSTDGPFTVSFATSTRADIITTDNGGFGVTTNFLISQIKTAVSGNVAYQYDLTYTTGSNGNRSVLQTITQSGKDINSVTTTLPPVKFVNQNNAFNHNPSGGGAGLPSDVYPMYADFVDVNGDGFTDIVDSINNGTAIQKVYLNTPTGWTVSSTYVPPLDLYNPPNQTPHFFADVNGDGLQDLIMPGPLVGGCGGVCTPLVAYLNTGTNWDTSSGWQLPFPPTVSNGLFMSPSFMQDVNGDGLPDIMTTDGHVYLNNGSGWNSTSIPWNVPVTGENGLFADNEMILSDVNGDGIMDEMISYQQDYLNGGHTLTSTSTIQTWLGNGNASFTLSASFTPPTLFQYNHDDWGCSPTPVCQYDLGVRLLDINGDGLPDLVQSGDDLSQNPNNLHELSGVRRAYINTGNGWSAEQDFYNGNPPPFDASWGFAGNKNAFGDFDGDGNGDVIANYGTFNNSNQNQATIYNFALSSTPAEALTQVTYATGGTSGIQYKPTPQFKDGSNNLLNPKLPFAVPVVSQITTTDTVNNVVGTQNYTYKNGTYYFNNPFDRKFAGFGEIDKTDAASNVTKMFYHTGVGTDSSHGEYQDNYFKIGKVYRTEQYDNNSNLFSKTINKWDSATSSLTSLSGFVKLVQGVKSDYDGAGTHKDKAESYSYNNSNGNQTQKVEYGQVTGSDDGTYTDTGTDDFTTAYTYASSSTSTVISSLSDVTVTDHGSNKVKETRDYYDSLALGSISKGNQTKEENWKTGSTYINTQKTYDGTYGLVTQTQDPRGKQTNYSYDTNHLYPATVTQPLSLVTQYTYNYATGKTATTTDPNGNIFGNSYDGLGRLLLTTQPDPAATSTIVSKIAYSYSDALGNINSHETDYMSATNTIDSYTYYDSLQRPIQSRKSAKYGNFESKDSAYNNLGLLQKETLPYFSAGSASTTATSTTALYTNYAYDALQRPLTIANTLGTTTHTYFNWKDTITDPNSKVKDLLSDAFGNLIEVDEHNGTSTYTTTYTYDGLNDLTSITDASGNVRNFTYDGLGRRLTGQDLHASADATYGTWNYTYDDASNLTTVLDPKSQTINYGYDDLNRVLTEDYTGATGTEVTYTYDTCTQGKGRLCNASSTALSIADVYNALGQMTQETRTIDGSNYVTGYTFDRLGNQLTITNPDNSKVNYVYNIGGLVDQVQRKENADTGFNNVVSNFDYSPTEQPSAITYANGVTTTNTYDPTQLYRLSHKVSTLPSTSKAQDISYTYDPVGNITQIVNASANDASSTISYIYDDLYRLTSASATGTPTGISGYSQTYAYDPLGNFTSTSDQGAYSYTGNTGSNYANPHAVTSIGTNNLTYDNNGNLTSQATGGLPWYSTGGTWTTRKQITIDHTKVASSTGTSLVNFPVLVSLVNTDLKTVANGGHVGKSDGTDILFTSNDGLTKLSHEVEKYASSTGETIAWVNVLALSTSTDTTLIMYYGNASSTDQQLATSTWDSNFKAVWHLKEDPTSTAPQEKDSTTDAYNGTSNGGQLSSDSQAGKIGNGLHFDGSNDYVDVGSASNVNNLTDNLTVSAWINKTSSNATERIVAPAQTSSANGFAFGLYKSGSACKLQFSTLGVKDYSGTGNSIPASTWTYVTAVMNNHNVTFYINGVASETINGTSAGNANSDDNYRIGATTVAGSSSISQPFPGVIDQVEISGTVRNADWIKTAYNNQSSTSTFLSLSNVPTPSNNFSWDYLNRMTQVTTGSATSTYAYDPSNERIKATVATGTSVTTYYPTKSYNITGNIPTKQIFANGQLIATITGSNATATVYSILTDNLTGSNVAVNASGTIVELLDYLPYGADRLDEKNGNLKEQRQFAGHEFDPSSGLNYMDARYYSSKNGRFLTEDPAFLAVGNGAQLQQITNKKLQQYLRDPQGFNSYTYARNNPLLYNDPTGQSFESFLSWVNAKTGIGQRVDNSATYNYMVAHPAQGGIAVGLGSGLALTGASELFSAGYTGIGISGSTAATAGTAGTTACAAECDKGSQLVQQGQKLLNGPINITADRLGHVVDEHTIGGLNTTGKSIFNASENVVNLIKQGTQQVIEKQAYGPNFQRIFDVGRNIGIDRATGQQTSWMTIITNKAGSLITSFPGKP